MPLLMASTNETRTSNPQPIQIRISRMPDKAVESADTQHRLQTEQRGQPGADRRKRGPRFRCDDEHHVDWQQEQKSCDGHLPDVREQSLHDRQFTVASS